MENIIDEGTTFQFIGGEQYRMDNRLYGDQRSWFEGNTVVYAGTDPAV
jgi:hypothetical protein